MSLLFLRDLATLRPQVIWRFLLSLFRRGRELVSRIFGRNANLFLWGKRAGWRLLILFSTNASQLFSSYLRSSFKPGLESFLKKLNEVRLLSLFSRYSFMFILSINQGYPANHLSGAQSNPTKLSINSFRIISDMFIVKFNCLA